jgi:hypothetical protein
VGNADDAGWSVAGGRAEFGFCESSDADEPCGLEDADNLAEVVEAGGFDRFHGVTGNFVRRPVAAGILEEDERAEIDREVMAEEAFGRSEGIAGPAPEASSADF